MTLDHRDRIRGVNLASTPDKGNQHLELIAFRRARRGSHQPIDFRQYLLIIGFALDRFDIHVPLLNSRRIDRIVLSMGSHETHEPDSMRIVKADDKPVAVPPDVEHHPVVADDLALR